MIPRVHAVWELRYVAPAEVLPGDEAQGPIAAAQFQARTEASLRRCELEGDVVGMARLRAIARTEERTVLVKRRLVLGQPSPYSDHGPRRGRP
jgi:hypothetical protein